MKNDVNRFIIFIIIIAFSLPEECPFLKPIRYNNDECEERICTEKEIDEQICIISNSKVKTKWLNKIITNNEKEIINLGGIIHNNEIIISSINEDYLIYSFNAYKDNELNMKIINNNSSVSEPLFHNPLLLFIIINQLDYLLMCVENSCILINYSNNENEYSFKPYDSFYDSIIITEKNSLFKMNDNYNYFYATISNGESEDSYILMSKFNFNYIGEEGNNNIKENIISNYIKETFLLTYQDIISCFQTENNIIECMIVYNNFDLYIYLFDDLNLSLIQKIKIDILKSYHTLKCIHLKKEIGIYNYFYDVKDINPALKIKNLVYNENEEEYQLIDIINDSIVLNTNYNNDDSYKISTEMELFKISNKRFIIFYIIEQKHFLLLLCDLYGNKDNLNNLIIRYYKIPINIYDIKYISYIKGLISNNFISLAIMNYVNPLIIVFGYNSNIEPDIIININNINNDNNFNYKININNYFNKNIKINNNIFGYEFIGIKIDTLTGLSSGIKYYLNSDNNKILNENEILKINDEITIDYSNVLTKINNNFYLEISMLYGEADYEKFNSYVDEIEKYGDGEDPKAYFEKQTFNGKSLKVKYNFGCHKNCYTCEYAGITIDNQKCITCRNDLGYCHMNNDNNCHNISSLLIKYYNNSGSLICLPLNEICPEDYPFENKNTKECLKSFSIEDLLSNNYNITNNKQQIDKVFQLLEELIKNKTLNVSQDTILNGYNVTFHITTPERQKNYINNALYNNISSIDLNECEEILKDYYHIKDSLILMKIDIKRNDTPSTQVEYQILNPENGQVLDLAKCDIVKVNIYVPVTFDNNTFNLLKQSIEQGYDIFNPNDPFYNDICTPYNSLNNTDMIIKDRKIDIYDPNLTLCEEICEYKSFDINTLKVNCECQTKTDVNNNITETKFSPNILLDNFFSFDKYTNYKVLKCFNLAFNLNKLIKNIGSYIIIFILLLFIVILSFNFKTQNNNYNEMFNSIIYSNLLIEKKNQIKESETVNDKNNKIIILTEPDNKNKTINNRPRLSFDNLNNIDDLQSQQNYKRHKSIDSSSYNKSFNSNSINIENIFISTMSLKEDSINSINILKPIKSPNKMNNTNRKIVNIETGSEIFIENKISNSRNNNNNSYNKNYFNVKNEESNTSIKSHVMFEFDTNDKFHKNNYYVKRNKSKLNYYFDSISSTRKINPNTVVHKINNNNSKNEYKEKINIKNVIKRKSLNLKNDKVKINQMKERISHILKTIPKSERSKFFIDNELNNLEYKYAIDIDFRSFFQYYWSLLKQTHPIIFTFIAKNDYNLYLLKIGLFSILFALNLFINALFFSDDSMHKLYINYGKFDFLYNIPQTLYSALISGLLSFLFEKLSLSEDTLLKFKEIDIEKDDIFIRKEKEIKCLIIRSIIFFIFGVILLLFFWYYLSCFCAVYYNTQIPLIKDTFISLTLSLIYPFPLTLIPTFIRIPSLKRKSTCLYRISRILTFIISLV